MRLLILLLGVLGVIWATFATAKETKASLQKQLQILQQQFEQGKFEQVIKTAQEQNLGKEPQVQYLLARIYRTGRFGQAFSSAQIADLFQNACDADYTPAYHHCAINIVEGYGAKLQNYALAEKYFSQSVAANEVEGIYLFAILLSQGKVFTLQRKRAFELYQKAAELKHAPSQLALANAYYAGLGVDKNLSTARNWYEKAGQHKQINALLALGRMYEQGDGVKKNLIEAHKFYNLASSLNSQQAQQQLVALSQDMPLKQVLKAQQEAQQWVEKHWN